MIYRILDSNDFKDLEDQVNIALKADPNVHLHSDLKIVLDNPMLYLQTVVISAALPATEDRISEKIDLLIRNRSAKPTVDVKPTVEQKPSTTVSERKSDFGFGRYQK